MTLNDSDEDTQDHQGSKSQAKQYHFLQDSSSSSDGTPVFHRLPRKGADSKRQRFAEDPDEIIEIPLHDDEDAIDDEDTDSGRSTHSSAIPQPLRLEHRMEIDTNKIEEEHNNMTIAELLGEGPEHPTDFPRPLMIYKGLPLHMPSETDIL